MHSLFELGALTETMFLDQKLPVVEQLKIFLHNCVYVKFMYRLFSLTCANIAYTCIGIAAPLMLCGFIQQVALQLV